MLALQYASESLAEGEIGTAKKILLFAEMVLRLSSIQNPIPH
jgi:hypothetical protein